MDRLVKSLESKSFSGEEIKTIADGAVNVVRYRDLQDFNSIDDVLGEHGAAAILFETRPNYGHWCLLFKVDNDTLEFFDPYGYALDEQAQYVPKKFLHESGMDVAELSMLIAASPYDLVVNKDPLQKLKDNINSCGRWVGLRLAFRDVPLEVFQKLFYKQKMPPDWYVTALTLFV